MDIVLDMSSIDRMEWNDYVWSNEHSESYKEIFSKLDYKFKPKSLVSVGGGDHILFALAAFDTITRIDNIDVSPIGLLSTLMKLSVLCYGTKMNWFELQSGSLPFYKMEEILRKADVSDVYSELLSEIVTSHRPAYLSGYGAFNCNQLYFCSDDVYQEISKNIKKIGEYNLIVHDIFTAQPNVPVDLALVSNAYNYIDDSMASNPVFLDHYLHIGSYLISSAQPLWKGKTDKMESRVRLPNGKGGWDFESFIRVK